MAYYHPQPQSQAPPIYSAQTPNPQQTYQTSGPRTLHVYHDNISGTRIRILDSDKCTPLYTITSSSSLFASKPHMRIADGLSGAEISTITFHTLSSDIDLTVHNRPILLSKPGFFSSSQEFRSLATGGVFKWKRDGMWSCGIVCVDERDVTVARFEDSGWSLRKEGRFEITPGVGGVLLTEVVTSGVAVVAAMRAKQVASAAA